MNPRFPLDDVIVRQVTSARIVKEPVYADSYWQMNQSEFAMQVEEVGNFYACNGDEAEYAPSENATPESIELYLNGSVYGAILHQRQILPLHGSCFQFNGSGVMICGDSGAGKSSLTVAFCLAGSSFLTDDVTPVLFNDKIPYIFALSDRLKLWDHTLEQLGLTVEGLKRIGPGTAKYYYNIESSNKEIKLDRIYILEPGNYDKIFIDAVSGSSRFSALRNEIYRPEYLRGMTFNEKIYFENLIDICNYAEIYKVRRPENIPVNDLMMLLKDHIGNA
jgi:hypothetical protein